MCSWSRAGSRPLKTLQEHNWKFHVSCGQMEEQGWSRGRALAEKAFSARCVHPRLEQAHLRDDEPCVGVSLHHLRSLRESNECPDSSIMLTTWAKQPLHIENFYCKSSVHSL